MQVQCSKCSEPIVLTDVIESSSGRLSHADCKRPHVLTSEERALVYIYCSGHVVARCPTCDTGFRFAQLAADMTGGSGTNLCPRCRRDLTGDVRAHLFGCAMLPAEVRRRAYAVREAAQNLVKQAHRLRDHADVLIREAEAALYARQRALREEMAKRTLS